MKLERIIEEARPGYPSFNEHRMRRRGAIKVMCGGLIAVLAAGCNVIRGGTPEGARVPDQPVGGSTNDLPLESPVPDGLMMGPDPPERPDPPVLRGKMVAPREPVRTKGRMAPAKPLPKK